jgi:putative ABC transport system permease protein
VSVLLLAVVMCCASGAIALRKIRSADPAEIF